MPNRGEGFWLPPSLQEKFRQMYICVWQMPDGKWIGNSDGEFLCAESYTEGDKEVESKMRAAARSYGIDEGGPVWMAGRKVSSMEADDQMERLLEGKIPDEREETLIALEDEWLRQQNGES